MIRPFAAGVVLAALALVPTAGARTRLTVPHVVESELQADKTFLPAAISVADGENVTVTSLTATSIIVPVTTGVGEPCSNVAAWTPTSMAGPRNKIAGVFARRDIGSALGPEIVPKASACDVDTDPVIPTNGTTKWCANNADTALLPQEMFAYDELAGVILLLDFDVLRPTNDPVAANWVWTNLDAELNQAAWNGKSLELIIVAGADGMPTWPCTDFGGAVTCAHIKSNNSSHPGPTNCGSLWWQGSVGDPDFGTLVDATWTGIADHIHTRADWTTAFVGGQGFLINAVSGEFKVGHSDGDGDTEDGTTPDGILNIVNGDVCVNNNQLLANAGWNNDLLRQFVVDRIDHFHDVFGDDTLMLIGLIQGGFGSIVSTTNFEGDDLCAAGSVTCNAANMICPACGTSPANARANDDLLQKSIDQLQTMIPATQINGTERVSWGHYGRGFLPTEHPVKGCRPNGNGPNCIATNCSWGVDPTAGVCGLVPLVATEVKKEPECPNRFTTNTTVDQPSPYLAVGQSNNRKDHDPDGIDSPAAFESTLNNDMCNTNGVQMQFYDDMVYENHQENGTNGVMDPLRDDVPTPLSVDPAFNVSHSMKTWTDLYRARRSDGIFIGNFGDPYPDELTFEVGTPGTFYYTAPGAAGSDGLGCHLLTVTVTP